MIARRSPLALAFFDRYVPRYLARRFHRVWLWGDVGQAPGPPGMPRIFVMSHASWWDVLVGYYLTRRLVGAESYAPMDAQQLRRYRILARLGLYPVDRASVAGARAFLRDTRGLLTGDRAVWITPQGEFVSNWRRPVRFQPGVGHVVRGLPAVAVVPVAVAYEFLEEPRPEVFVKFGPPRLFRHAQSDPAEITHLLERDLERELDAVLSALVERDVGPFSVLLEGVTSVSLVYDRVRAVRAWLAGRPDPARHGDVASGPPRRSRR